MRDKKVDQLAAILKSAGLCASVYDANNMARSISDGVRKRQAFVEKKIVSAMGTGKRDETLFEPTQACVEEPKKEVFVNQDSIDVGAGSTVSQILEPVREEVPEPVEEPAPEPVKEPVVEEKTVVEKKAEESISLFKEPEADFVFESSEEKEVVVEPVVKPVEQVAEPVPAEPKEKMPDFVARRLVPQKRELIRGDNFYELEMDRSAPRVTLTEAEKKSTDLTKFFNFSR